MWSGKYGKSIGIIAAIIAVGLWGSTQRPEILIADQGRLIGVLSDQGRALSMIKGKGFVADVWMENDGMKLDRRDALIVSQYDVYILGTCLVLQKRDFYVYGATYIVWTGEVYAIKKRVDKHHAPYAWQPTSKRRQLVRADQSD